MNQCAVAVGDPFDGLSFYGPFDDHDAAVEWADNLDNTWWIVPLNPPDD